VLRVIKRRTDTRYHSPRPRGGAGDEQIPRIESRTTRSARNKSSHAPHRDMRAECRVAERCVQQRVSVCRKRGAGAAGRAVPSTLHFIDSHVRAEWSREVLITSLPGFIKERKATGRGSVCYRERVTARGVRCERRQGHFLDISCIITQLAFAIRR